MAQSPPAIAMYIVTLHVHVPYLEEVERVFRGLFHSWAQIPEGVRNIFYEMRDSEFEVEKLDVAKIEAQKRKIYTPAGSAESERGFDDFGELIDKDDVLRPWFVSACLISALSDERERSRVRFSRKFFEEYKEEWEIIEARDDMLTGDVRRYFDAVRGQGSWTDKRKILSDVRDLRDRLFAFVACGVRSSVDSDAQNANILQRLGFVGQYRPEPANSILELFRSLVIPLAMVVFFVVLTALNLPERVVDKLHLPANDPAKMFLFFVATAVFYLSAIMGGLWFRARQVVGWTWSDIDIDHLERHRPWRNYVSPMIFGMGTGIFTLFLIALFHGPGFEGLPQGHIISDISDPSDALKHMWFWFPVAMGMALCGVWASDTGVMSDEERAPVIKFWLQSLAFAVLMAIAALASQAIGARAFPTEIVELGRWDEEKILTTFFLPGHIALLSVVMCWIVLRHFYDQGKVLRRLVGRRIVSEQEDHAFALLLDATGKASCFAAKEKDFNAANAVYNGRWVRFPEGAVLLWGDKGDKGGSCAGDVGAIFSSGNDLVYQGFSRDISSEPLFTAQLVKRPIPINVEA